MEPTDPQGNKFSKEDMKLLKRFENAAKAISSDAIGLKKKALKEAASLVWAFEERKLNATELITNIEPDKDLSLSKFKLQKELDEVKMPGW